MPLQILELSIEPLVAKTEVPFFPGRASVSIRLAPGSQVGPVPHTLWPSRGSSPKLEQGLPPLTPNSGSPDNTQMQPIKRGPTRAPRALGSRPSHDTDMGVPSGKEEVSSRLRPEDGAEGPALSTLSLPAPSAPLFFSSHPQAGGRCLSSPRLLAAPRPPSAALLCSPSWAGQASEQERGTEEGSQTP